MNSLKSAVYASFVADALSLGPHWVYNQSKLARTFPEGVREYTDPLTKYHPHRQAGQFTHYGDQTLALLRSLAFRGAWSAAGFGEDWSAMWADYDGYLDGATKETLAHRQSGTPGPSASNDLAGAARLAPLLHALRENTLEEQIEAARAQTALTHGDGAVIDSAEFFTRAAHAVRQGADVPSALEAAARSSYQDLPAADWLDRARQVLPSDPGKAAAKLGLTCHVPEAFPATLYFLLRFPNNLMEALSANALAGGDSSARGMLMAAILGLTAKPGDLPPELVDGLAAKPVIDALLTLLDPGPPPVTEKVSFPTSEGHQLEARLERPDGPIRSVALFAHCFTCGKNIRAAVQISRALAAEGIATLRFDFSGLGESEGDFAETSFLTNVEDLLSAGAHLRQELAAPTLLIGHSLGGAAVLAAANRLPECKGVATLGAPADPAHVTELFSSAVADIQKEGSAEVTLGGRPFRIGKRFLDDVAEHCQECEIAKLGRDLLIMHAPDDAIVGLENARRIYEAARHPKSFLSLDRSDHLLTTPGSAAYAARIIAAWASRLI